MERNNQEGKMSTQLNQLDIAYIAGLFDGEGSVDYARRWEKRTKGKYKVWRIRCEVAMTDKYVLEWIRDILGVGTVRPKKVQKGMKPQWRWRCSFREAYEFAKLIWPHVQVKIHKIEQLIDHYTVDDLDPPKPLAKVIYLNERRK